MLFLEHFVAELDKRGHSVTFVTNIPPKQRFSTNVTQVIIDPPLDVHSIGELVHDCNEIIVFASNNLIDLVLIAVSPEDVLNKRYDSDTGATKLLMIAGLMSSRYGLKNDRVQRLIHSNDLQFDLVVSEEMHQESWLMFAHKFNAPIVTICKRFLIQMESVWRKRFDFVNYRQAPSEPPIFSTGRWAY